MDAGAVTTIFPVKPVNALPVTVKLSEALVALTNVFGNVIEVGLTTIFGVGGAFTTTLKLSKNELFPAVVL